MTHTGTPKPFRTQSLKVRLQQCEASRERLLRALGQIRFQTEGSIAATFRAVYRIADDAIEKDPMS